MATLSGVEAVECSDKLADMVAELEMKTPVGTLVGMSVKELSYTQPRWTLRHWQRQWLIG